jgi:hypothetical protein
MIIMLERGSLYSTEWFLTCSDANLDSFRIVAANVEDAQEAAINLVGDRMLWLMKGWMRELKIEIEDVKRELSNPNPSARW